MLNVGQGRGCPRERSKLSTFSSVLYVHSLSVRMGLLFFAVVCALFFIIFGHAWMSGFLFMMTTRHCLVHVTALTLIAGTLHSAFCILNYSSWWTIPRRTTGQVSDPLHVKQVLWPAELTVHNTLRVNFLNKKCFYLALTCPRRRET